MISIEDLRGCCGCTACASTCPHDAITMEADAMGFLYPKVDANKCVECGLCEKVCQFNDNYDRCLNLKEPVAFAARHKDTEEIMKSRSGATFAALSDYILEHGGVVYGAGYKDHFRVAHKRASAKDERDEFRGSKYVQSDMRGVFRQVKEDLKNGIAVMFTGTPCQTSGLNAYVGKRLREKLYLVDIVCHGVPGPNIWRDYLSYIEKKKGSKITYVNFRDKELFGWKAHVETFRFEGSLKKIYFPYLFYQNLFFRPSCSVCHFTNLKRPSDITLADYWGWERTNPDFNADDRGCSLVICNTEKGLHLFNAIEGKMDVITAELVNIMQTHLSRPSEVHPKRKIFEEDYSKNGFEHAAKKVGMIGWLREVRVIKNYSLSILRRMKHRLIKIIIN